MEDVAELAGVSRALVSLVMRGSPKVSEKSRAAVLAAAEECGYRLNLMASNLATGRTRTIGVLLNDLHNPFFAEVADGVQEAAAAAGYRIVINSGRRSSEGELEAVDTFLEFRVDGIIVVGPWLSDERLIDYATEAPLAVVGRRLDADGLDTINTDDRLGAQLVVDHLADLGHERIAHIDGGLGAGADERREGYRKAMTDHGIDAHVRVVEGDYNEASGRAGVEALLGEGEPPTAVFAANDLTATGALDGLEDAGLRVPDDVSLVGYDNTALAALHHMSLTTVHQPRELMGTLATASLIERLDGADSTRVDHVIAPELVERSTTAPPPASGSS